MPVFSRRTIQMMLDEIREQCDSEVYKDLVARLNNKKTEQVIPAEAEISVLYALKNFDGFIFKPKNMVSGKEPEFGIKNYIHGIDLVGEVYAVTDGLIQNTSNLRKTQLIRRSKLYKRLKDKKDQIQTQGNTIRLFILAGFQSELLSKKIDPMMRLINESKIFGEDILAQFIDDYDKKVSAILLLNIDEIQSSFRPVLNWSVTCTPVDMQPQVQSIIDHLLLHLPKPLTKGVWARTAHNAKKFAVDSPINYQPTKLHWDRKMGYKISISSRALLDFLAHKISEKQFRSYVENEMTKSIFQNNDQKIIDQITILKLGPERDDDLIEITFKDDVAVQKYR